jgi:hypothetical protein
MLKRRRHRICAIRRAGGMLAAYLLLFQAFFGGLTAMPTHASAGAGFVICSGGPSVSPPGAPAKGDLPASCCPGICQSVMTIPPEPATSAASAPVVKTAGFHRSADLGPSAAATRPGVPIRASPLRLATL